MDGVISFETHPVKDNFEQRIAAVIARANQGVGNKKIETSYLKYSADGSVSFDDRYQN